MKKIIGIIIFSFFMISCTTASKKDVALEYYNSTIENSEITEREFLNSLIFETDKFKNAKYFELDTNEIGLWGYKLHPIILYGVSDSGNKYPMYLRLKLRYHGTSWLFFDEIIFLYEDGTKNYRLDLSKYKNSRFVYDGVVTEEYDISLNEEQIDKIEEIMKSPKLEYRIKGSRGVFDSYIYKEDQNKNLGLIKLYKVNKEKSFKNFINNSLDKVEGSQEAKNILKELINKE